MEWQFVRGHMMPPCSVRELDGRRVDQGELASLVADHVTTLTGRRSPLAERFIKIAVDLIEADRRADAAAIFRVAVDVDEGPSAHNNYGFCLLPDKPDEALAALQRVAELGWGNMPINVCNRIHGMILTGKLALALDLAEKFFETNGLAPTGSAWLWAVAERDSTPKMVGVGDVTRHIFSLAQCAAALADDDALLRLWTLRSGGLESSE